MNSDNTLHELDDMRLQFGQLKQMLKKQTILNDKMMRRAMKGDYNKVRADLIFSIVFELVAIPLQVFLMPWLGLPLWFTLVTVAFLFSAFIASVYSLRKFASDDIMTGNLTGVASKIVRYKRFGICWFFYAMPFLVFWLCFFFSFITKGQDSEFVEGVVWGGIIGGSIGLTLGFVNYAQNLRRMNRILQQIREVKECGE